MLIPFGRLMTPSVGSAIPAKSLRRVDFPAPFFPTRAIRSLAEMTNEISSKRGLAPKYTDTLLTLIMRNRGGGSGGEIPLGHTDLGDDKDDALGS